MKSMQTCRPEHDCSVCNVSIKMRNLTSYTDEELALLYCEGDNSAFDELLSRTQGKLFSYILFVVHNEDRANDIFQETFVKAITKLQQGCYTNNGKFSAWITRIAHNVIMDWYRSERVRNIVEWQDGEELSDVSVADIMDTNIENLYVNEQVLADVQRIMNMLPPAQREVVYMRYYQDMPFKDIAVATGVSINTSLGRMRYAVSNMRRMAKEHRIALYIE